MTEEKNNTSDDLTNDSFFTLLNDLEEETSSKPKKRRTALKSTPEKQFFLSNWKYIIGSVVVVTLLLVAIFLFSSSESENDAGNTIIVVSDSVEKESIITAEKEKNQSSEREQLPIITSAKVDEQKITVEPLPEIQGIVVESVDKQDVGIKLGEFSRDVEPLLANETEIQLDGEVETNSSELVQSEGEIVLEEQPIFEAHSEISIVKAEEFIEPHLLPIPSSDSIKEVEVITAEVTKKVLNKPESKAVEVLKSENGKKVVIIKSQHKLKSKLERNSYKKATLVGDTLLANNVQNHFSLQLMAVNTVDAKNRLDKILFNLSVDTDPIIIFSSQKEQNISYVCYGYYASREEAKVALKLLDKELVSYDPYVISIEQINSKVQQ